MGCQPERIKMEAVLHLSILKRKFGVMKRLKHTLQIYGQCNMLLLKSGELEVRLVLGN